MIEIEIKKPLDGLKGRYCGIRDIYLKAAIARKTLLKITVPSGSAEVDPQHWIKTGKRVTQIFKDPNNPMVLYRNYVPLPELQTTLSLF